VVADLKKVPVFDTYRLVRRQYPSLDTNQASTIACTPDNKQ